MSRDEVREIASFTPKGWERKVQQLLVEARNAKTIDGYWRDKDRSNPTENRRRMRGMLDFTAFVSMGVGSPLHKALPYWKRKAFAYAKTQAPDDTRLAFTLYLEAKTGRGKPNSAQEVSIERANRNPGAHAFVVYPSDLIWLRRILGI
jgi:hypothetical protein